MKIKALISVYEGNYKRIEKECLKLGIEVVLYNKKNNKFGIPIKNVGVDAYDKFHYIIENYEKLPDIILFSTDNMFGNPKKAKKIRYILDNISILKNRSGFLTGHIYKIPEKEIKFTLDKRYGVEIIKSTIRPFDKWFNQLICEDTKVKDLYVCKKSTFAITKDLILKISKKNYEKYLKEVEIHSLNGHDSEVPHYFEMAYVELFCKSDKSLMFHDFKTYGSF
tara:strand:+ start:3210 stop:3878 length:669 start_codon:yes stop_codon:yes gene_type:complete